MFTGEYRHTVDDKGRLAVPAKFRAQLATGAVVSRWIDGCLAIHDQAGWEALSARLSALPLTNEAARLFQRQIYGGAFDVELDRQGRILIPGYLREEVGLTSDAVVAGIRDHAEIWAPKAWDDYRRAMTDPRTFADAIAGLGI
ncbi:MAG TPA: division/cell wall cluster transcriptional repressor MraZ [Candidatus Limnocylindrales bacterium]|nr:division/cell wall cluster transcriptional repressor MraZ [Candidatus Limnocylindrales bacterium]